MSVVEEGLHSVGAVANGQQTVGAVANGQSAAFASHLVNNDEEYEGEHNEEEEEEEEEGQAAGGTPTGAPSASASASASVASCSSRVSQPKKASLNAIPFPLARVKRLIKNEDDTRVSSEATYVIAKGVGLFLEKFVEHSFEQMINDRRHSLTYKDLATHVSQAKRFHFLADFVPEKVTAASALSSRLKEED